MKPLIEEAQSFLVNNPQDSLHDLEHSRRVWENAKKIVEEEKINALDMEVLEVICMWHDVYNPTLINKSTEERIAETTAKYVSNKVEEKFKDIVLDSIKNHEFGSTPKYIEGKILQDADKLDILSKKRIKIGLDSVKAGKLSKEKFISILTSVRTYWIPNMEDKYHFEYSKSYHRDSYKEILKFIDEVLKELDTFRKERGE